MENDVRTQLRDQLLSGTATSPTVPGTAGQARRKAYPIGLKLLAAEQ